MSTALLPEVVELTDRDIHAILARNITGRIGFVRNGEVEIRPISYVYSANAIYLRSNPSSALSDTPPGGESVGFEVDEIHSTSCWRSVVVHGTLVRISRRTQDEEWVEAVNQLRRLSPEALREDDPYLQRGEVFRIDIRKASGRGMT